LISCYFWGKTSGRSRDFPFCLKRNNVPWLKKALEEGDSFLKYLKDFVFSFSLVLCADLFSKHSGKSEFAKVFSFL
jgi:hypothetical protein